LLGVLASADGFDRGRLIGYAMCKFQIPVLDGGLLIPLCLQTISSCCCTDVFIPCSASRVRYSQGLHQATYRQLLTPSTTYMDKTRPAGAVLHQCHSYMLTWNRLGANNGDPVKIRWQLALTWDASSVDSVDSEFDRSIGPVPFRATKRTAARYRSFVDPDAPSVLSFHPNVI
jgi:hypothetical protein